MRTKLSWNNINSLCKVLIKSIRKSGKTYSSVYGIPRGGLILAVILSHLLNIKLITRPRKNSLVVDEICDSGKTLTKYKKYDTIVLLQRKTSKYQPTFVGKVVNNKSWIIFPWET